MSNKMENPKPYQCLVELWFQIKGKNDGFDPFTGQSEGKRVRGAIASKNARYNWDRNEDRLLRGAWAWSLIVEDIETGSLNRCGEVLSGPIFSSDEHPWPYQMGMPMLPCLQIDLQNASSLSGADFGEGAGMVLQLWMSAADPSEYPLFRLIPRDDVVIDKLVAIPAFDFPDDLFPNFWHTENVAKQIVGYSKQPSFTMQEIEFMRVNKEFLNQKKYPELPAQINEFNEILKEWQDVWNPAGTHLFGTFYPVQYSAAEVPTPLLCLDNDHRFMWGDNGTAQLCYSLENGCLKFSFVWSCF